ncbi:MAG: hypothetical protein ABIR36_06640, partial [Nitrospiraceae bacterium]
ISKWIPNCWINIEAPTAAEKEYLLKELQIPEAFYNDIEDGFIEAGSEGRGSVTGPTRLSGAS